MSSHAQIVVGALAILSTLTSTQADEPRNAALGAKVQAILQANCYRCHGQDGAVEGGMNYVTDRRQLVSRNQVVPGESARSRLYRRVSQNEMPPEGEQPRPSKEDIASLKEWIDSGAPDFNPSRAKRSFISPAEVLRFMRDGLQTVSERDRRFTRYFTLTHLYNAGMSEDELQTYRSGLSKLLNSLSWSRRIVPPQPVDPARTILRVDLRDYQWSESVWDSILAHNPYGIVLSDPVFEFLTSATETRLPHVRGDWFVAAASRPPLYHDVLRLPMTDRELENLLRVDADENIRAERVQRSGFNGSGVSRNNRLIERHDSAFGAYWRSYDFANSAGRKNLFSHPLGPGKAARTFEHDGGELIFSLPNGLQAYMLVDGKGRRIDKAPADIVSDPRRPDKAVENGISCMSCHVRGLIEKADQIRDHVQKNRAAFSDREAESILALYPANDKFLALVREDSDRFQQAVAKTGSRVSRTEPIVALTLRFEGELDLLLAAAEAGMRPDQFGKALAASPTLSRGLGPLSIGGTVYRDAYVAAFGQIVRELELGTPYRPSLKRAELPPSDLPPSEPPLRESKRQTTNSIGMKLVLIPPGEFDMGSSESDRVRPDETPQHRVRITKGFYLGVHEVTQEEYEKVMGENPSWFSSKGGGKNSVAGIDTRHFPVERVSWDDAVAFCQKLSARAEEKREGRVYRLPTEAEWEYACRAETSTRYHYGDGLAASQANFSETKLARPVRVGSFPPSKFGLHDMHGNLWEWCADWYDERYYQTAGLKNPTGPDSGKYRVLRGGSWGGTGCRAAERGWNTPGTRDWSFGFRVVAEPSRNGSGP